MRCFLNDKALGLKMEADILRAIQTKYPLACQILGDHKEYDLYVPEVDMKIEVKSDQQAINTGNFIVEIEMYGKMSGLMTTTANFWAFSDGEKVFWVQTSDLKELIIWRGCKAIKNVGNGKGRVYIIPVAEIEKIASSVQKLITT